MTKEERLLKKVIKTKAMINDLQDNLQLIFDSKIVNSLSTSKKEFIGKCMWIIPHFIEQTYRKYLLLRRDEEDVNYLGCVL